MKGKYVTPARTPVGAYEAVAGFRAACRRLWKTDKPETVATLTAQSALESARWAAMWRYNPSNIKHGPNREGLYTCIKLNERLARNGKLVYVWFDPTLGELLTKNGPAKYPDSPVELPPGEPQCRMRAYDTFADGIADKLAFLDGPRWAPAKAAALSGKPDLYVDWCKGLGYFTAALEPYQRSVVSLFKTYLPIAKKQAMEPEPLPPEQEEELCLDMAQCLRTEIPDWLRIRVAQIQALGAAQEYADDEAARRRERDEAIAAKDYS